MTHEALIGAYGDEEAGVFGAPTAAMKTNIQKELLELRQNADELIGIEEGYNRDLMTLGARMRNAKLGVQSYLFGTELSPDDEAFRRRFLGNKTRMVTSLSAVLNRLSGAAVSPQEYERIETTRPSHDDDPDEARFKMETAIALNQFAVARMAVWEMMGQPEKIGFAYRLRRQDVRNVIKDKMTIHYNKLADRFTHLSHEELMLATSRDISEVLGVRPKDLLTILTGGSDVTFAGGDGTPPEGVQ
jgi:hypothetical protein